MKQQYSSPGSSVIGMLSNGSRIECDLLIGSDGINSKVRRRLCQRIPCACNSPPVALGAHPLAQGRPLGLRGGPLMPQRG